MTAAGTSPEALAHWLAEQRWFDRTGSGTAEISLHGPAPLPGCPTAGIQIAQTLDGHRYQLLVPVDVPVAVASDRSVTGDGSPSAAPHGASPRTSRVPGAGVVDRAAEPEVSAALVELAVNGEEYDTSLGTIAGRWLEGEPPPGGAPGHALGAEQSNTSVVVGGTHVLKVFRRLTTGAHPEVEVGRHLHDVAEHRPGDPPPPVAPLSGWYDLVDAHGGSTTLGVVNRLVPGALDGWSLTLSALAAHPPELLPRLRDLGVAVARLHTSLAQPATRPVPGGDRFGVADLAPSAFDDVIVSTIGALEALVPAVSAPGVARLTDRTAQLSAAVDRTDLGVAIRTHGDLHLGQTVIGPDGWVILDFEGEPTRPMEERRRHHSPLRDVAGMLRSLSYAAETVRRSAGDVPVGWEPAARAAVLDGYLSTVDPALLPRSMGTVRAILTVFEVEKAVYEVGYELAHRPDWVELPLRALERF